MYQTLLSFTSILRNKNHAFVLQRHTKKYHENAQNKQCSTFYWPKNVLSALSDVPYLISRCRCYTAAKVTWEDMMFVIKFVLDSLRIKKNEKCKWVEVWTFQKKRAVKRFNFRPNWRTFFTNIDTWIFKIHLKTFLFTQKIPMVYPSKII